MSGVADLLREDWFLLLALISFVLWLGRMEWQVRRIGGIGKALDTVKETVASLRQTVETFKQMLSPDEVREHHVTITAIQKDIEFLQKLVDELRAKGAGETK